MTNPDPMPDANTARRWYLAALQSARGALNNAAGFEPGSGQRMVEAQTATAYLMLASELRTAKVLTLIDPSAPSAP